MQPERVALCSTKFTIMGKIKITYIKPSVMPSLQDQLLGKEDSVLGYLRIIANRYFPKTSIFKDVQ